MGVNSTMCEFLSSVQHTFDEACIAFAQQHNMSDLAKAIGVKENVLRNMLNPEQPRVLTAPVLFAMSKAASDYAIVNALLRDLDVVVAPAPTGDASDTAFIERTLTNSVLAGEISQLVLDNADKRNLPRSARNQVINKAQAGISNLVLLINNLENRTTGLNPLLSMGVDFIANGAPIPGLS